MKALGVGVRVWIGWCAPSHCIGHETARLKTGTIFAGPFLPGTARIHGTNTVNQRTMWNVRLDSGEGLAASEQVLFPIDDDGPQQQQIDQLVEVPA